MKNIKPIVLARDKAREEWKKYVELCKKNKLEYLQDLKGVYYYLKQERKIIDIFEAFKKTGLNENFEPKLAICKATESTCYFEKGSNGTGDFKHYQSGWKRNNKKDYMFIVSIPQKTFQEFPLKQGSTWEIAEPKIIRTKVLIIPAKAIPKGVDLSKCFILWEVNKWEDIPKDPFLLKRITRNLFVVLSSWNLTKLEQAVIRGRL